MTKKLNTFKEIKEMLKEIDRAIEIRDNERAHMLRNIIYSTALKSITDTCITMEQAKKVSKLALKAEEKTSVLRW